MASESQPHDDRLATENSSATDEIVDAAEHIRQALRGLRFGEVSVVVQDGVVVQVERTERKRVRRRERSAG